MNLYSYGNSPVTTVDPAGLSPALVLAAPIVWDTSLLLWGAGTATVVLAREQIGKILVRMAEATPEVAASFAAALPGGMGSSASEHMNPRYDASIYGPSKYNLQMSSGSGGNSNPCPGNGGGGGTTQPPNRRNRRIPGRMEPDPNAVGPHSVSRRLPDGRVGHYETYKWSPQANRFVAVQRFRGEGGPHGGMNPPFILDPEPGSGLGSTPVVPRWPFFHELPEGF